MTEIEQLIEHPAPPVELPTVTSRFIGHYLTRSRDGERRWWYTSTDHANACEVQQRFERDTDAIPGTLRVFEIPERSQS